jgi:hypothetical protein
VLKVAVRAWPTSRDFVLLTDPSLVLEPNRHLFSRAALDRAAARLTQSSFGATRKDPAFHRPAMRKLSPHEVADYRPGIL